MTSTDRRLLPVLFVLVVLHLVITDSPFAQAVDPPGAIRIVFKLKPASAPGDEAQLRQFRARHGIGMLQPVYDARNRSRLEKRLDDAQLTAQVRRRFSARARRQSGSSPAPDLSRAYVFEVPQSSRAAVDALLTRLARDPDVEYAERDTVASIDFVPNDPYYSTSGSWGQAYDDLYGLKKLGAEAAWDSATGQDVTVAVVDTGIDYTHVDLANNVWVNATEVPGNGADDDSNGYVDDVRGWDFIGAHYWQAVPDADPADGHGHGTHVAGTIAAEGDNGIGVIGVAWHAKVMAVKGLDDGGSGYNTQLANAIVYAVDNGADVINASWGGSGTSQTIQDAVDYATSVGVVFVAAAGNSADDARKYYPSGLANVITVAASDANDVLAYFSNWGPKIDVAAPGVDVLSLRAQGTSLGTPVGDAYTRLSGTSMASPHVAGIAALILGKYPAYSTEQVRQAIRMGAADVGTPGYDETFGYGRADASQAVLIDGALNAAIQSPSDSARVTGIVSFTGLAFGPAFVSYELAYGAGNTPPEWTTFYQSTTPAGGAGPAPNIPVAGPLGALDTSAMPDGLYTVRLTVFDAVGRQYIDRRLIVVDYVRITNPPVPLAPPDAPAVKAGVSLPIEGTATGPSFIGYRVEWARGINPASGWSASAVVLEQNGTVPVDAGVLATWDTSAITDADYYTVRLLVDNAGFTSEARTLVYLEPDLLTANWPKLLHRGSGWDVAAHPAAGPAGERLLAIHSWETAGGLRLWKFAADGSSVQTIDDIVNSDSSPFQAVTAELDGEPGDEVILAHANFLRVFRGNGATYQILPPAGFGLARSVPLVEDLDGVPGPEILAVASYQPGGTGRLQAWKPDGTPLGRAFPVAIADASLRLNNTGVQRLVVADLDDDGSKEIVVAEAPTSSSVSLRLLNADGTPRAWTTPTWEAELNRLAAADLDGDGTLEVLALVRNPDSTRTLHVLGADGTEKPGWPFSLPGGESGLALADFDRDGRPEIVLPAAYEMYVLRSDGQTFSSAWPRSLWGDTGGAYYFGPAVTGDLDGDGIPEIVVPTLRNGSAPNPLFPLGEQSTIASQSTTYYYEHKVLVIRRDGTMMRSWEIAGVAGQRVSGLPVPVIADVDGDGTTDVVLASPAVEPGNFLVEDSILTVLTTGSPYKAGANDWPTYRHDTRNTAVLPRDRIAPVVTLTSPATGATITGTTTLSASASDDVFVRGVQFQVDGVDVGSEDVESPFETAWDPRTSGNGAHVLTAVARDPAGNRTTSAPVSVTVDVDLTPPQAAITTPAPGATVSSSIVVLAEASDDRGVTRAELYVDGALAATDTAAPYEFSWNPQTVGDGQRRLIVKAIDEAGNVGASDPVDVTVAVAPQVTFWTPSSGATISGSTTIQVWATDNTGVLRVEFYANGSLLGTDSADPWFVTWNAGAVADGPYTLQARAYDAAGNVGSAEIPVTVYHTPTAAITSPAWGAVITGPVQVTATAADGGGISRVELFVDSVLRLTDTEAPYVFDWNAALFADGWHDLSVRAYDPAGNMGLSPTVSVRVMIPPAVTLTSPASGAALAGTVDVTADASDNVAVARVELFVDGVLAGTDSAAPWTLALDTEAYNDGSHTLSLKAYDNAGNVGLSNSVPVTTDNHLATYDPVLKVPKCAAVGVSCSSGLLLNGRGTKGPEPNQPNTINASCGDGTSGSYHADESNDRITVSTLDGSPLGVGKNVQVRARVWAYSGYSSDRLDLYYAADAQSPAWTFIGTFTPAGAGAQTITATYMLPMGGLQAVRARFRYSGSAAPCATGSYDDHDDLVFAVETPPDSGPPTVSITSPASGTTIAGATTVTADAADDVAVTRVELYVDGTLAGTDTTAPYTFAWNAAAAADGSHSLVARAYDPAGNVTASEAVPVTVAIPPVVSITSPSAGSTASGVVTVVAQASDNSGVARVEFFVDGALRSTDSASPFNFAWDTTADTIGNHALTATAYDAAGNHATSAPVTVQVQRGTPGTALYDAVLKAPRCNDVASACDSASLLVGRSTKGPEPNAPNTINSSCVDGSYGSFHVDESNDRIRVATLDGTALAPGKTVRIEVTVWAYSAYTSDKLDLFYTANAGSPTWTYLTTLTPTKSGSQVLSATYTLPAGGLQGVRANFRYSGSALVCTTGGYDDHDDLIFAVQVP